MRGQLGDDPSYVAGDDLDVLRVHWCCLMSGPRHRPFGGEALALDLSDPVGDDRGIGAGLQRGSLLGESRVGVGQQVAG